MTHPNGTDKPLNSRPRRTHGFWVKSREALARREVAVRALCTKARTVMSWLTDADTPVLRSWAEIELIASQLFCNLQDESPFLPNGEPRRILTEYRQLKQTQLQYTNALLMTPAARAALQGGDTSMPRDFIAALAQATRVDDDTNSKGASEAKDAKQG